MGPISVDTTQAIGTVATLSLTFNSVLNKFVNDYLLQWSRTVAVFNSNNQMI